MADRHDTPGADTATEPPKWSMSAAERRATIRRVAKAADELRELLAVFDQEGVRRSIASMVEVIANQAVPDPYFIGMTAKSIEAHMRYSKEARRSATVLQLVPVSSR